MLEPTLLSPFQVFSRNLTIRGFTMPAMTLNGQRLPEIASFGSDLAKGG